MAYYSTNDFKSGLKVMLDGNPCSIMENEYVKPGKGQAFNRVKLRNLRSGKVLECRYFRSDVVVFPSLSYFFYSLIFILDSFIL